MIRPLCDSCINCTWCKEINTDNPYTVGNYVHCICEPESDDIYKCCPNIPMLDCDICFHCKYINFCYKDYYESLCKNVDNT